MDEDGAEAPDANVEAEVLDDVMDGDMLPLQDAAHCDLRDFQDGSRD